MVEFFQTMMGRKFFEHDVPELIKELKELNANLKALLATKVAGPTECRNYEPVSRVSTNCRHCGGAPGDHF